MGGLVDTLDWPEIGAADEACRSHLASVSPGRVPRQIVPKIRVSVKGLASSDNSAGLSGSIHFIGFATGREDQASKSNQGLCSAHRIVGQLE